MSAAIAAPMVNGFTPSMSTAIDETAEYQKILKLRDEILAGTHPRLTVPAHAIRKVSPLPVTQLLSASHTSVPPPFPAALQQSQLPGLSLNDDDAGRGQSTQSSTDSTAVVQPKVTASGIDPVLLTKSEDLVRAETQIHRQRLEKALRDQFEQKRLDARKRPAPGEAKPDFDVTAVLAKALGVLEVTKPDSGVKVSSPGEDVSASESYDENSLYSSRAPDSTPEVGELEDNASLANQVSFAESSGANGTAEAQPRSSHNVPSADQPRRLNSRAALVPVIPSGSHAFPASNLRSHPAAVDLTTGDDDEEEGEYSPPEAVEEATTPQESGGYAIDPRSRPLRRYSELGDAGARTGPPNGNNMRIVRNHITSPIAPQPSRVSPLAVAKQSLILQNHRERNGRAQRGRDDSPDVNSQNMPPRKKRKLERKAEKRRRMGKGSPDIKDEPVSPPPFHNVQPLGSGKLRPAADERSIILDDPPPREVRYVQAANPFIDSPLRPMSGHAESMMPISEPRVMSRASMRPPQEPDLRRVASMHNMRDMQPREYVEPIYESPSRTRAPSYVRVDSPMRMEPPRLAQESPVAYERSVPQGMRVVRTPAPVYREVYQPSEPQTRYVPEPMPPPVVERIVVDADGRKYREIIETRGPATPRAVPNYVDRESSGYYDNYNQTRAGSVFVDAAPETRYAQAMPPPRIARQVVETGPVRRETYDPMPVGRSMSVAPVEHTPRQIVYVDDRGEFREPSRMGSIRPPPSRYEEQPVNQSSSRLASVRPPQRQGSVFVEDRLQGRQEYVPMATPQYQVMERPSRYFDEQGREIIMEGGLDGGHRYVQRY